MILTDEECLECGLVLPPGGRLRWTLVVAEGRHTELLKLVEKKVRARNDVDSDYVYYSALDEFVEHLIGEEGRAPNLTNALLDLVEKKL